MNGFDRLTNREREVITAMLNGALTNHEIARSLVVTERTVQTHLAHIYMKLGVSNRSALILMAERARISQMADDTRPENHYSDEQLFYLFRLAVPVEEMPADVMERVRQRVMTTIERMARSGGGE